MSSFITAALTLALLLAATAPTTESLSCPCWDEPWQTRCTHYPTPTNCKGGLTSDICYCCDNSECAKVNGETCEGIWGHEGSCDKGLYCQPDWEKDFQEPGVCVSLRPKYVNEECGGKWNGAGDCSEGLTCKPDNATSGWYERPGVCIITDPKVEGEKCMGFWGLYGHCDKGLYCKPDPEDIGFSARPFPYPAPGVCISLKPKREYDFCGGMWNHAGDCAEGLTCTDENIMRGLPGFCKGPHDPNESVILS